MWKRRLYRVDTNTMRLPSGENRGSTLTAPFASKGFAVPLANSKIHNSMASLR